MSTLGELLKQVPGDVEKRTARRLLAYVSGYTDTQIIAHPEYAISIKKSNQFLDYLSRYQHGEPLAYLIGSTEFYGLTLRVTPDVLIPRPDTECLIDCALACLKQITAPRILDLGTGSGAIALALASQRPDATLYAVDRSLAALAVASHNAQQHNCAIHFIASHWLTALLPTALFDLIISNPPYIANNDSHLPQLTHEPLSALTSGPNGLDDLSLIFQQAPAHLKTNGWLLCEHGWTQGPDCRHLAHTAQLQQIQTWHDLSQHERITGGQKLLTPI